MARPFTRNQQLENAAFLKALRRSGNVRAAARAVGLKYGTVQYRRAQHPGFALQWDVAVAHAAARLAPGGRKGPEGRGGGVEGAKRTVGGEPVVVRLKNGRLQVRAAQPGKLTKGCEQAFLLALSATCNVRLAARAAGAAEAAFYRRQRRDPGFAREWRLALAQGYERLGAALLESGLVGSHEDDGWRHNEPPALPPMTVGQALQLMYLHQKAALGHDEPRAMRRRRGESWENHGLRLGAMWRQNLERDREAYRLREAAALNGDAVSPHEPPIPLPDLAQVTGWSKADPDCVPRDPGRALFGGFRAEHQTPEQRQAFEDGRRR